MSATAVAPNRTRPNKRRYLDNLYAPVTRASITEFQKQAVAEIAILPEQFFSQYLHSSGRPRVTALGQKRLLCDLLQDAILILRTYPSTSIQYQRDLEWAQDGTVGEISLRFTCDALGFNYETVRAYLLRAAALHRGRTQTASEAHLPFAFDAYSAAEGELL